MKPTTRTSGRAGGDESWERGAPAFGGVGAGVRPGSMYCNHHGAEEASKMPNSRGATTSATNLSLPDCRGPAVMEVKYAGSRGLAHYHGSPVHGAGPGCFYWSPPRWCLDGRCHALPTRARVVAPPGGRRDGAPAHTGDLAARRALHFSSWLTDARTKVALLSDDAS
jgi:hypothetical protein